MKRKTKKEIEAERDLLQIQISVANEKLDSMYLERNFKDSTFESLIVTLQGRLKNSDNLNTDYDRGRSSAFKDCLTLVNMVK